MRTVTIRLTRHRKMSPLLTTRTNLVRSLTGCFAPSQLLTITHSTRLTLRPVSRARPRLVRTSIDTIMTRRSLKIARPRILTTVTGRALNHPNVSTLDYVIFLTSALRPNQKHDTSLRRLHRLYRRSLTRTICHAYSCALTCLVTRNGTVRPHTVLAHG